MNPQSGPMKKIVFISSTYQDLAEHRRAVWQALEEFDVSVRGMEQFGARPEVPLETCLAEVEQSDVYVGIIAFRIGSIHPESAKSFTQLEYERASSLNKAILIYLVDEESARVRYSDIDPDVQDREKLSAFKRTLRESHTVDTFTDPEDLAEKLKRDFKQYFQLLQPAPDQPDELQRTAETIRRFLLLPKTLNGREVRLRVAFAGEPYPAARAICEAFGSNMEQRLVYRFG